MSDKSHILVIDDEKNYLLVLQTLLEDEGYTVTAISDPETALAFLAESEVDVVVTDMKMPKVSGREVLQHVKKSWPYIPVLIMTAFGSIESAVEAMKYGAFDYITKPFDPVEVLARVKSQLRRYTLLGAKPETATERGIYTVGGVTLNEDAKSVTVDGESVSLTPLEFNILQLLIRSPGRIYSSSQIYELVWNENSLGAETSVAVHIRHLRQKIEINPSEPRYLKVVWGLGYKMEDLRHEKE